MSVVVSVSEVQAQTVNYISNTAGSVSQDVTEPTGNAGAMEFSYTFSGVDTPRSEASSVPLEITVDTAESTARLGVDFTIPENQTVNASVASPSPANSVKIMLLADTIKEGDEKIVLTVTLPPDSTSEVEFKQFTSVGGTGGPEAKSIKVTFNITDESTDTEIDPISNVPAVNYQAGIINYSHNGSDGTTVPVPIDEPEC